MPTLVSAIQGYSIHDGPGIRTVVFLKGCSLRCRWCSNPECISPEPELGFVRRLCAECGECAGSCPVDALASGPGRSPEIDRAVCDGCGACTRACVHGALVLHGERRTVDAVFDLVSRDDLFYRASGGGVTVSGGEPLCHREFVRALFERCRARGIHTCLETCGEASWRAFAHVLPYTDLILFDLKLMDADAHQRYTGRSNRRIVANAARVIEEDGVEVLFRMPFIPGINDDEHNLHQTAAFLRELGPRARRLQLMPYHTYGRGKYYSLGREYPLGDVPAPSQERLEQAQRELTEWGIDCSISQ